MMKHQRLPRCFLKSRKTAGEAGGFRSFDFWLLIFFMDKKLNERLIDKSGSKDGNS